MKNIIICGGSGTRLWPVSRKKHPKQFNDLGLGDSLFEQTVKRNISFCDEFAIVTNQDYQFLVQDQMEKTLIDKAKFILEPLGRNTAPAVALACMLFDEGDIVLVSASDHIIKDDKAYLKAISKAKKMSEDGYIVTFGIIPRYPETGYGYINVEGSNVISFKEKPDFKTAQKYIESGNYYWNSGMFMFKIQTFFGELEKYSPEVLKYCREAFSRIDDSGALRLEDMMNIPSLSIDCAVMEQSHRLKIVPVDIGWSDLGGFEALYEYYGKDASGNAHAGDVYGISLADNLIIASDRIVAAIDVEDLLIVDSEDALLVAKKGSSHKIKNLLPEIEEAFPKIIEAHKTRYRPWGSYTVLSEGEKFKIKKVTVKPNKSLTYHSHSSRSEHWTVVKGQASVKIADKEYSIEHNQTIYVPQGVPHRLSNDGEEELVIVETSVGENLNEEDIAVQGQPDKKSLEGK